MKFTLFFVLSAGLFSASAAKDYICNICGCENCTFADPLGVVNFVYDNKPEKRPCQQLQQEVQNPTIYNTTYCKEVIWRAAFKPCFCYNENVPDMLLEDIDGYGDRPYGNPGTIEYNPEYCDGDDCDSGSINTPGNNQGGNTQGGNTQGDSDEAGDDGPGRLGSSSVIKVQVLGVATIGALLLMAGW